MTDKNFKPFTATAAANVRAAVETISAPADVSRFRSAVFTDNTGSGFYALSARDPRTGLWNVAQISRHAAGNTQKNIMTGACLFDAVHYCAWFESSQKTLSGSKTTDIPAAAQIPHFKTTAEKKCDIAFDVTGLPLPAENGFVLSDASYDDHAAEIIARSIGKTPEMPPAASPANLAAVTPLPPQKPDFLADRMMDMGARKVLTSALTQTYAAAEAVATTIRDIMDRDFRNPHRNERVNWFETPMATILGGLLGALGALSVGAALSLNPGTWMLIPILGSGTITGGICVQPAILSFINDRNGRVFSKSINEMTKAANDLPKEWADERSLVKNFSKAASATLLLEHAAECSEICQQAQKPPKKLKSIYKLGLKLVAEAGKTGDFPKADTQRLTAAFRQGAFPKSGAFLEKLRSDYLRPLSIQIDRRIATLNAPA